MAVTPDSCEQDDLRFSREAARQWTPPLQLFLIAVVLPAVIVLLDHFLLGRERAVSLNVLLSPCLVVQVMLLGWCVGRFVQPMLLRWIIFVWTIALLDVQAFTLLHTIGDRGFILVIALFAAQIGLLVLWSILGPPPWAGRVSTALVAATVILAFLSAVSYYRTSHWTRVVWPAIILAHCVIMVAVCSFLRWRGFHLAKPQPANQPAQPIEAESSLRFSLRDMLLWATTLAPLLLVAKGLDVFLFRHLTISDVFPFALLAVCLALTSLLAIWVSLGAGNLVVRTTVALANGLLLGFALRYQAHIMYEQAFSGAIGGWWGRGLSQTARMFIELRDIWVYLIQMELWLLAAMLIFIRASGYQIVRGKAEIANL